jgi:hypothetical protein
MQSTNTLTMLTHDLTVPQGSLAPRASSLPSERDARDAGPWLALGALISLALTVVLVTYLSKLSFQDFPQFYWVGSGSHACPSCT